VLDAPAGRDNSRAGAARYKASSGSRGFTAAEETRERERERGSKPDYPRREGKRTAAREGGARKRKWRVEGVHAGQGGGGRAAGLNGSKRKMEYDGGNAAKGEQEERSARIKRKVCEARARKMFPR